MFCAESLVNFTEHPVIETVKSNNTYNGGNQERKAIVRAFIFEEIH
ncbi:hypothetical protein OU5_3570 [Pseudomonas mandelii JR-1]|jgi:hypothetical protein|uniref:Uncharacterized protein n=1 Tax=Pseudomonas mandelii JR-1 TaxID=1147786 RepID=A0A024ECJ6_9PSED|nr:hypothetical protein OU5_3570 [Pseudomonas mandelii JR-1]